MAIALHLCMAMYTVRHLHKDTDTVIPFTFVHLYNCRQLHRGPRTAHKSFHPATDTKMHTTNKQNICQTCTEPCRHRLLPTCTHLKIPTPSSHLHIHLHWGYHTDTDPNADPQYFHTCPVLSRHTLDIHTYHRMCSCPCHIYLCNCHLSQPLDVRLFQSLFRCYFF